MVMTDTVNDDGFARWNYDLPAHTDMQQINEDNSNAEEVD
jgi:hypothetical protein